MIRTPHGSADVELVHVPEGATLGGLVRAVTGQAPPPTATLDGRRVSTVDALRELPLRIGSLIDTGTEIAQPAEAGGRSTADPVGHGAPSPTVASRSGTPSPFPRPSGVPVPIDTGASAPPSTAPRGVELLQLTGRGAGTARLLTPGRYRIGPGRRVSGDELTVAPVEQPAFEIVVDDHEPPRVAPGPRIGGAHGVLTPRLDGELFDRPLTWTGGLLEVAGRVFAVEPARRHVPVDRGDPDPDGVVAFHRAPGPRSPTSRLVVDALRLATGEETGLWHRRSVDVGAHAFPFALAGDPTATVTVDFQRHRGVALVGTDRFTAALARTILVAATTTHGPADLEVVVASTRERLGRWDWAKWLPHVRPVRGDGRPRLFGEPDEIESWTRGRVDADRGSRGGPPDDGRWTAPAPGATQSEARTILVLDDVSLWSRRDSPLRPLLVDPPADLRVIARCEGLHEAPGLCTALIEEIPPDELVAAVGAAAGSAGLYGSLARLHSRTGATAEVLDHVRPALVESSLATSVARAMAPLDDLALDRPAPSRPSPPPPSLDELLDGVPPPVETPPAETTSGETTSGAPPDATTSEEPSSEEAPPDAAPSGMPSDGPSLRVPIGVHDPEPGDDDPQAPIRTKVEVDLGRAGAVLVSGPDVLARADVVAALGLGACLRRTPRELAVLTVGDAPPVWAEELPHAAGHVTDADADPRRLIQRIGQVVAERDDLEVLVVVDRPFPSVPRTVAPLGAQRPDEYDSPLVTGLLSLTGSLPRLHLVLSSDLDPADLSPAATERVTTTIRLGSFGQPSTTTFGGDVRRFVAATASRAAATGTGDDQFVVRPVVFGRPMTPLERRLGRTQAGGATSDERDVALRAAARRVARRTGGASGDDVLPTGMLLPPPLPSAVDARRLLDAHPGDGVPLGLVDRPERAGHGVYWWQPGSTGSLLVLGSPRSGVSALLDTLALGIAARFGADDVHVYAIEPLPQRRRAFEALPHSGLVTTTDDPTAVRDVVDTVERLFRRRSERSSGDGTATDEPTVVLVIGDLGRLRRWLPADVADEVLERLATLAANGPAVGVDVVAVAHRLDELGPLARLTGDRLVGQLSDPDDLHRLGVRPLGDHERHPGRCFSTADQRQVQLAAFSGAVDQAIVASSPEPPRLHHPVRPGDQS